MASEFRICFLGALNPALTTSKKPSGESNGTTGASYTSMRTTDDHTFGAGLNERGGTWHTTLGLP